MVFPASLRSFCCFQESLSQARLCHISNTEVWQNWQLVQSENICRVMALKLCLPFWARAKHPKLCAGQRWAHLHGQGGFLFPQAFTEWSWTVQQGVPQWRNSLLVELGGGEWEWAHFATGQGKLVLFHGVPSNFISESWVTIKQDPNVSHSAEPAALSRVTGLCSPLAGGLESLDTSVLGWNSPFLTCYWQPPKTETPWVTAMDEFHQLAVSN